MLINFIRTLILFGLATITLRLMGKRQIGEMEPAELVVTILISELISVPMQNLSVPLLAGVIPVLTVLAVNLILSHMLMKSVKLRKWVEGQPSILVHNGRIQKKELNKNRVCIDELMETLRLKNVTDIATVQYAILETNGQLSVMLYPEHRPPTAAEWGGQKGGQGLPVIVVNDGRWLDHNIQALNLSRAWVTEQARQRGAGDIAKIFLMTVDEKHNIFLQAE